MKKLIILILVNFLLFVGFRILSVIIAFLFGIGASTPSQQYVPYVPIPSLVLHLLLVFFFYFRKKYILELYQLVAITLMIAILFTAGIFDIIPF